jgi:hypothetical protein
MSGRITHRQTQDRLSMFLCCSIVNIGLIFNFQIDLTVLIRFKKVFLVQLRELFNQPPELDFDVRIWPVVVYGDRPIIDLIHKLIVAFGGSVRAEKFFLFNDSWFYRLRY